MKILKISTLGLIIISFWSCSIQNDIQKFKFTWELPLIDTNRKKIDLIKKDQIIYKNGDNVIIEEFVTYNTDQGDSGYYEFYFFNTTDTVGKKFMSDPQVDTTYFVENFKVLDIKREFLFHDLGNINIVDSEKFELVKKSGINNVKEYKEHFSLKKFVDATYPDSVVITFNKDLKGYPFSLSNILEKEKNTKVEKIQLIFKGDGSKTEINAQREFIYSIKSMNLSDKESIRTLFSKFANYKS